MISKENIDDITNGCTSNWALVYALQTLCHLVMELRDTLRTKE